MAGASGGDLIAAALWGAVLAVCGTMYLAQWHTPFQVIVALIACGIVLLTVVPDMLAQLLPVTASGMMTTAYTALRVVNTGLVGTWLLSHYHRPMVQQGGGGNEMDVATLKKYAYASQNFYQKLGLQWDQNITRKEKIPHGETEWTEWNSFIAGELAREETTSAADKAPGVPEETQVAPRVPEAGTQAAPGMPEAGPHAASGMPKDGAPTPPAPQTQVTHTPKSAAAPTPPSGEKKDGDKGPPSEEDAGEEENAEEEDEEEEEIEEEENASNSVQRLAEAVGTEMRSRKSDGGKGEGDRDGKREDKGGSEGDDLDGSEEAPRGNTTARGSRGNAAGSPSPDAEGDASKGKTKPLKDGGDLNDGMGGVRRRAARDAAAAAALSSLAAAAEEEEDDHGGASGRAAGSGKAGAPGAAGGQRKKPVALLILSGLLALNSILPVVFLGGGRAEAFRDAPRRERASSSAVYRNVVIAACGLVALDVLRRVADSTTLVFVWMAIVTPAMLKLGRGHQ